MDKELLHILSIALGGCLFVLFYVFRTRQRNNYLKHGVKTIGTVIDVVRDVDLRRGGRYYYPVVKFILQNGDWFIRQHSDGNLPPKYKKGDKVTVVYKEASPESYMIVRPGANDIVFLFIGLAVLGYAAYSYLTK